MTPKEIMAMRGKLRKAIAEKNKIRGHPLTPQERLDNLHRANINMPTQSEIDRTLVLLHRSNNASDYVNFVRPAGWLDKLPMAGLDELVCLLERMKEDVAAEIARRQRVGQTTYPLGEYVGEKAVN